NLASALVRLGRPEEAAALLREDRSPQRFGSRLRADRIEARGKPPLAPPRDAAPAAENAVPVAPRDEAG
ncbi:MAG: hypothetical protein O3C39_12980, partial [Planctomycetota bacterium]|nr:hypothetical protein [Planctomycetota bacterium]